MAKFLSSHEIEDIIKNYINDERMHQAILIDGDWGSGKTYFVKQNLLPDLKKFCQDAAIIMISLYGACSVDDIQQLLFETYVIDQLGKINK